MGQANYGNGFELTLQPQMLELPLRWKKPQTIFVNSMSDLFHKDVPLDYIQRVFDVMRRAHWHRFQVLTKRSERLAELDPELDVAGQRLDGGERRERRLSLRIDDLRATGARSSSSRWSRCSALSTASTCAASTGSIVGGESGPASAADGSGVGYRHPRPVPASGACRSSSSSGAARTRRRPDGCSKGEPGTRCRAARHDGSDGATARSRTSVAVVRRHGACCR